VAGYGPRLSSTTPGGTVVATLLLLAAGACYLGAWARNYVLWRRSR
jgi:hypothetical protein